MQALRKKAEGEECQSGYGFKTLHAGILTGCRVLE
jgi:hypothetical protein